ncbi:hypothetical protein MMPV_006983, partial [Pyropia vietnamensis]
AASVAAFVGAASCRYLSLSHPPAGVPLYDYGGIRGTRGARRARPPPAAPASAGFFFGPPPVAGVLFGCPLLTAGGSGGGCYGGASRRPASWGWVVPPPPVPPSLRITARAASSSSSTRGVKRRGRSSGGRSRGFYPSDGNGAGDGGRDDRRRRGESTSRLTRGRGRSRGRGSRGPDGPVASPAAPPVADAHATDGAPLSRTPADEAWLAPLIAAVGTPDVLAQLRRVLVTVAAATAAPPPGGRSRAELEELAVEAVFPYALDTFQRASLRALIGGKNVVVSAPTSGGKTVVGEMALYLALARGRRAIYTTPLKALSNQKAADFAALFGANNVGLLTGDAATNREGSVLVMTTEIYRNMMYEEAWAVGDVDAVVFDEFHYMADPDRGTVWEESVIYSPPHVRLVALSATMANAPEVRDWFAAVHGPTAGVVSGTRPVPLRFSYCNRDGFVPLFAPLPGDAPPTSLPSMRGLKLHPAVLASLVDEAARPERKSAMRSFGDRRRRFSGRRGDDSISAAPRKAGGSEHKGGGGRRQKFAAVPSFPYVVRGLRRRNMLPAIIFVFSRAGCDRAAEAAATEDVGFIDEDEAVALRTRVAEFAAAYPDVADEKRMSLALAGIASHHAGMLPLWKAFVEELFQAGLLKVVFATETLAAGINMPARTTVISSLSKRGNDGIEPLTTSAVLQMAGRAGRRGMDAVGYSVLLRSAHDGAREAHRILTRTVEPLCSHFTPTYGMVLNILSQRPLTEARRVVEKSFGAFQTARRLAAAAGPPGAAADDRGQAVGRDPHGSAAADADEAALALEAEDAARKLVLAEAVALASQVPAAEVSAYTKLKERLKAERRAEAYLRSQAAEADAEVVEEGLAFAPPGTAVLLRPLERGGRREAGGRSAKPVVSQGKGRRGRSRGSGDGGAEGDARKRTDVEGIVAALRWTYLGIAEGDLDANAAGDGDTDNAAGGADEVFEKAAADDGASVAAASRPEVAVLLDMTDATAGVLPTYVGVTADNTIRVFNATHVARLLFDTPPLDVDAVVPGWQESIVDPAGRWPESAAGDEAPQTVVAGDDASAVLASAAATSWADVIAPDDGNGDGADADAENPAGAAAYHPEVAAARARRVAVEDALSTHPLHVRSDRDLILRAGRAVAKLTAQVAAAERSGAKRRLRSARRQAARTEAAAGRGVGGRAAATATAAMGGGAVVGAAASAAVGSAERESAAASNSDAAADGVIEGVDVDDDDDVDGSTEWGRFLALKEVLTHFGYLTDDNELTPLGVLGAYVRADNELWMSLLLQETALDTAPPPALAAALAAATVDGSTSRPDAYVGWEISAETAALTAAFVPLRTMLTAVQDAAGVDMAVPLDDADVGLIEAWAGGDVDWPALVARTSLQEGDICRRLRRVLSLLRQVPGLPLVSEPVRRAARAAITAMDRFPVADEVPYIAAAATTGPPEAGGIGKPGMTRLAQLRAAVMAAEEAAAAAGREGGKGGEGNGGNPLSPATAGGA